MPPISPAAPSAAAQAQLAVVEVRCTEATAKSEAAQAAAAAAQTLLLAEQGRVGVLTRQLLTAQTALASSQSVVSTHSDHSCEHACR